MRVYKSFAERQSHIASRVYAGQSVRSAWTTCLYVHTDNVRAYVFAVFERAAADDDDRVHSRAAMLVRCCAGMCHELHKRIVTMRVDGSTEDGVTSYVGAYASLSALMCREVSWRSYRAHHHVSSVLSAINLTGRRVLVGWLASAAAAAASTSTPTRLPDNCA